MRDEKVSGPRLALLHPAKRDNFKAFIEDAENALGITLRIVQGLRTFAEQDALYAQGRTTPGAKVTAAKGGQSWHNYGFAVDLGVIDTADADNDGNVSEIDWQYKYNKIYEIAAKYGISNGSGWKDYDHFEDNMGHGPSGWNWALAKWNAGDVTNGYITI